MKTRCARRLLLQMAESLGFFDVSGIDVLTLQHKTNKKPKRITIINFYSTLMNKLLPIFLALAGASSLSAAASDYIFTPFGEGYAVSAGTSLPTSVVILPTTTDDGGTVVAVANGGFTNQGITAVTIPAGISYVGAVAFYQCANLKEASIAADSIGSAAFAGCPFTSFTCLTTTPPAISFNNSGTDELNSFFSEYEGKLNSVDQLLDSIGVTANSYAAQTAELAELFNTLNANQTAKAPRNAYAINPALNPIDAYYAHFDSIQAKVEKINAVAMGALSQVRQMADSLSLLDIGEENKADMEARLTQLDSSLNQLIVSLTSSFNDMFNDYFDFMMSVDWQVDAARDKYNSAFSLHLADQNETLDLFKELRHGELSVFSPDTYSEATLHVPSGTLDAYRNHTVWGQFTNIAEDVATVITAPSSAHQPSSAPSEYFDLSGRSLPEAPSSGLYIIRNSNGEASLRLAR